MNNPEIPVANGTGVDKLCRIAEIRRVLVSMKAALPEKTKGCVAVTSTNPGEGKTTLSVLLGAAVADCQDKKVLLADLHWRYPGVHTPFGLERDFDLDSFLDGNNPEKYIQHTEFENLDILSAPSPAQLEGQRNLSFLALSVVERIREFYDFVLLDTSAVFPTNRNMVDPVVVGTACDGVIMTILAASTPKTSVRRAIVNMEVSGANVLGTVLNQWRNLENDCSY